MADKSEKVILTKEQEEKLKNAFSIGCTIEEAEVEAEITHQQFIDYCALQERDFLKHLESQRLKPIIIAKKSVVSGLDNPDLALKYLERKKKDEFSLRQEHTGAEGERLMIILDK